MARNVRTVDAAANLVPVGVHAAVAVTDTAVGLTVPAGATHVWFTVETAAVRMRLDGEDAETAVGLRLTSGSVGLISATAAQKASFVRATGTSGTLQVQGMAY